MCFDDKLLELLKVFDIHISPGANFKKMTLADSNLC